MEATPDIPRPNPDWPDAWPPELDDVQIQLDADAATARYRWAAQLATDGDVLDAGCGTGSGIGVLLQGGARSVTGVDIDAAAIEHAAATVGPGAEVLLADATRLPFASGTFDVVTCFETIGQIAEPAGLLAELRRVLKPSGRLLISAPNPADEAAGPPSPHQLALGTFSELVRQQFTHIELYRQRSCLGTFLEPLRVPAPAAILSLPSLVHQTAAGILAPSSGVLAVASSEGSLPSTDPVAVLGAPLELTRWKQMVTARLRHQDGVLADALSRIDQASQQIESLQARLHQSEQALARVGELEAELGQARDVIAVLRSARLRRTRRILSPVSRLPGLRRLKPLVRRRLRL